MAEFYAVTGTRVSSDADDACCPLCQQNNQCAMTRPDCSNPHDCWCMQLDEKIPEELLEQLPPEVRGQRCVCQRCVERYWRGEMP